jgi:hypothetical protein
LDTDKIAWRKERDHAHAEVCAEETKTRSKHS